MDERNDKKVDVVTGVAILLAALAAVLSVMTLCYLSQTI